MVLISSKGIKKVTEEKLAKQYPTRGSTRKLMSDVIKANKDSTTESRRRRKTGVEENLVQS